MKMLVLHSWHSQSTNDGTKRSTDDFLYKTVNSPSAKIHSIGFVNDAFSLLITFLINEFMVVSSNRFYHRIMICNKIIARSHPWQKQFIKIYSIFECIQIISIVDDHQVGQWQQRRGNFKLWSFNFPFFLAAAAWEQ